MTGRGDTDRTGLEDRVLVLHGYGRSAEVIRRRLEGEGVGCQVVPDVDALAEALAEGAGAVVVDADLVAGGSQVLYEALDAQPPWSELPIVVLVGDRQQHAERMITDTLGPRAAVALLEQPARGFELVSAVSGALRARRRQYELRELYRTLEARVDARTEEVRELSRRLARAEQQERRRIAQVLHDDLQQMLYGVNMKMSVVKHSASSGRTEDVLANLSDGQEWLTRAMELTRSLSVDLSPPALKSERLQDVMHWLRRRIRDMHGLEVEVRADGACTVVDEDLRLMLFQTVRELLFNVVKHAEADRAVVELSGLDGDVRIDVSDEGRGFDPRTVTGGGAGFGLASVRERIEVFGGHMEIKSAPGKGTCVTLVAPRAPHGYAHQA